MNARRPHAPSLGKRVALDFAQTVWSRHKWLAILVFTGSFSIAGGAVLSLPNIYRSTATVLVEGQPVSEAFVQPSVTSGFEARLQTIKQTILSRSRLTDLIARFDLYPNLRKEASPEEVVEQMRRDVKVEMKNAEDSTGHTATTAFAISYQGPDLMTVALVANTLASFYIDENLKLREGQAARTSKFLLGRLQEAKQRLDEQERRIESFKSTHSKELPQQTSANLAALEQLNTQLRVYSDQKIRAMDRLTALTKQLAEADASRSSGSPTAIDDRFTKLNQELAQLRSTFSDDYPDVIRVKSQIAALKRELAESDRAVKRETAPLDPTIPRLKKSIDHAESEIETLKSEQSRLMSKIAAYQVRVENAPRRDREVEQISREYGTTKQAYESLLKRYEDAQLAESMEQYQKGEQFRILDPAIAPRLPFAPARLRLMLLGLFFSFAAALAAVVTVDRLDTSFHAIDELRAFTRVPVLLGISRIVTSSDRLRRFLKFGLATVTAVLFLIVLGGLSYHLVGGNQQVILMLTRGRS